jgi:hypothetical protein
MSAMAKHHHHARHPITGTAHPHHPDHVHAHDRIMEHEHARKHPDHELSFHWDTDHPSAVRPEDGSHTQGQHHVPIKHRPLG